MTIDEILTELEGHYAHDAGDVDSGVHDTARRAELADAFDAFGMDEQRIGVAVWVREAYLSDEALAQGYGDEDALKFLEWLHSGDYRPTS
jgi:hypothetical protein